MFSDAEIARAEEWPQGYSSDLWYMEPFYEKHDGVDGEYDLPFPTADDDLRLEYG